MSDSKTVFEPAQAERIRRRIDRAFEVATGIVDDPKRADLLPDRSRLSFSDPDVPNPGIPEFAFIVTATTILGDEVKIAIGVCVGYHERDEWKEKFWLEAGQQWVCPERGRVYSFDGETIAITEPDVAVIP